MLAAIFVNILKKIIICLSLRKISAVISFTGMQRIIFGNAAHRDAIRFPGKIFVDDGKFIKCGLSGLHISFQGTCDISFGERTKECGMRLESGVRKEEPDSTRRAAHDIRYISLDEAT